MLTAEIFVNIPVKRIAKSYTYLVPDSLSFIRAGWRVFVPFGGRKVEGFVLSVEERNVGEQSKISLKEIQSAVDDEAWFSPRMIRAAQWLSSFYLCSLAEMMRLFMPGKSGIHIEALYRANPEEEHHVLLKMAMYGDVFFYLLKGGPRKKGEIGRALPQWKEQLTDILEKLVQYHVLTKEYLAEKRDRAQYVRSVQLQTAVTEELLTSYARRRAQRHLLCLLSAAPDRTMTMDQLKAQKISRPTIHHLEEAGLVRIQQQRILRDSYREIRKARPDVTLTEEQKKVVDTVIPFFASHQYHGFLLKGVTGSGKTQVYIELAKQVRALGRQVIVLVPEIALTGQVVLAFKAYFSQDIVVIHSRLSLSERNDAILRIRRSEAGIIIGARSALFTPAEDIGLIIMDEEQDMSYKQDESPRYHARVVAEELSHIHQAVLLLGSATPSLESYYRAVHGEFTLLEMSHRIGNIPLPRVKCVDMRQELCRGNRHILSADLQHLIETTIGKGQQAIIMLNRRGFSTFVLCRSCGAVIKCKLCGLPLVYHQGRAGKSGWLACHHCDVTEEIPQVCPKCGSRYIKYFGSGTEKLEQELHQLVPSARVIRMDRDTTTSKFAHQDILERFRRGEYDILLGTQMVAKGHDIPNVTAVGVISADSSLNMPDFRAAERCFMLITQTAGRAGRHTEQGRVVIQTYNPEHYAVTCGISQDYEGFFRQELALRQQLFYPPYSRLIKLLFQNEAEAEANRQAAAFVRLFQNHFPGKRTQQIIGPSPAVIACLRGTYRYVVLIKTADIQAVQVFLREQNLHLRADVAIDIDPITML